MTGVDESATENDELKLYLSAIYKAVDSPRKFLTMKNFQKMVDVVDVEDAQRMESPAAIVLAMLVYWVGP